MTSLVSFTSNDLGVEFISSRLVANLFELRHDNVLQKIRGLVEDESLDSLDFQESSYQNDQNKIQPMILLTASGFNLLTSAFNFKTDHQKEMRKYILKSFSENLAKILKQVKSLKQRNEALEASEQKALGSNYPRKKTATMGYILQHNEGEEFPKKVLVPKENYTEKELAEGMIAHSESIIYGHTIKIKKLREFIELCD